MTTPRPRLNVRDYGVAADGVTDDSDALDRAFNAAYEARAFLYCDPPGTILVTRRPVFPRTYIPALEDSVVVDRRGN